MKPTYEELTDLIQRLAKIDCDENWPGKCWDPVTKRKCILLVNGFCKEITEMSGKIKEDKVNE